MGLRFVVRAGLIYKTKTPLILRQLVLGLCFVDTRGGKPSEFVSQSSSDANTESHLFKAKYIDPPVSDIDRMSRNVKYWL